MPKAYGLVLALLLTSAPARAGTVDVSASVALLSRYPAGLTPPNPDVLAAVAQLGAQGDRTVASLLRNLSRNEHGDVQTAASAAIDQLRERERGERGATFDQGLPDEKGLSMAARRWRSAGLGEQEALCAAYASAVLGSPAPNASDSDALVDAEAREDQGDVRGAVQGYVRLAAKGDLRAREALDGLGVDRERVLLGLLADKTLGASGAPPGLADAPAAPPEVLDVLVRDGQALTVAVLVERTHSPDAADRASAATALARMVDGTNRDEPLPGPSADAARRALATASHEAAATDPVDVKAP